MGANARGNSYYDGLRLPRGTPPRRINDGKKLPCPAVPRRGPEAGSPHTHLNDVYGSGVNLIDSCRFLQRFFSGRFFITVLKRRDRPSLNEHSYRVFIAPRGDVAVQKKSLDVGAPESLAHTEGLASFESVLVLRDLLVCELGHEFKAGLDLFDGLGLKDASGHCICPDRVTDL